MKKKCSLLIIILLQVDYIEDDGWDFCSALWQLNLQGNQVLLRLCLFLLFPIGIIVFSFSIIILPPCSLRSLRGTSCGACQVSPILISGVWSGMIIIENNIGCQYC